MFKQLLSIIQRLNPWLQNPGKIIINQAQYQTRKIMDILLKPDWDKLCLVLVGPRQSGKTTLGKLISQYLIDTGRFQTLLYLNCDFLEIRQALDSFIFIEELMQEFRLATPIVFIDEVQRLKNPGLLIKTIIDMKLPIKLIVSGSSQLEIKSKIQEFLTGRQLESIILPFSYQEIGSIEEETLSIYGCYPDVIKSQEKEILLDQLYKNYINRDVIEILKIKQSDEMEKLITLIAHSSGQLINYNPAYISTA
jgi:predicted AAA+ superfamily ATPase